MAGTGPAGLLNVSAIPTPLIVVFPVLVTRNE